MKLAENCSISVSAIFNCRREVGRETRQRSVMICIYSGDAQRHTHTIIAKGMLMGEPASDIVIRIEHLLRAIRKLVNNLPGYRGLIHHASCIA
jgi:hypothetical protein